MSEIRPDTKPSARSGPTRVLVAHHAVGQAGVRWIRGSTRCLLDLLAHIDRSRFEPIVWCNEPVADEIRATGVAVHTAPDWAVSGRRFGRTWMAAALALARRYDVGLLHADEYTQAAVLVPVARTLRRPLLVQLHRIPTAGERRWSLLHQADLAVGCSRACLDGLLGDGYPPERAVVIYNGVDPKRLGHGDARHLREELRIPSGQAVIGVVAYLVTSKAVDVALRAFKSLLGRGTPCHMVICGDGPERGTLEAEVDTLGIRGRTHFIGERRDVGAVLRDSTDILLSTSRDESFGLALAEAGVFGVPVVASDIAGHREVLGEGRAGLLVEPGDVAGYAEALQTLIADRSLRRASGDRLRRRVEQMFLVDRYVHEVETAYGTLLAKPASSYGWLRATTWPHAYTAWVRNRMSGRLGRSGNPGAVN